MDADIPADVRNLHRALEAAERDAEALVAGLSEEQGTARLAPGSWSVAECLDHLGTGNRVYLAAMLEPADRARRQGRARQRPVQPGWLGGLFVASLEPPPWWFHKMKAPRKIRPTPSPPLGESFNGFMQSHAEVRDFLYTHAHLDLASIRFPNPFISVFRFSLATGLHVLSSHARRHLWQAWRVRRALESTES